MVQGVSRWFRKISSLSSPRCLLIREELIFPRIKKFIYLCNIIIIDEKGGEKPMGTILKKNVITRRSGYLYYVDGKGNVCEAKMARGGKRKKRR